MVKQKEPQENKKPEWMKYSLVNFLSEVYCIECKSTSEEGVYRAKVTGIKGHDTTIFEDDCKFKNWTTGRSGNIYDLVDLLDNCGFVLAKEKVSKWAGNKNSNFPCNARNARNTPSEPPKVSYPKRFYTKLIEYAESRCISRATLEKYCIQVNIQVDDEEYYHIGFKNDKEGYVLRNKFAKRNLGKTTITTIEGSTQTVQVFEGFFDMLSYVEVYPNCKDTLIVLNSNNNLTRKVKEKLKNFDVVCCWFDNDKSGEDAFKSIQKVVPGARSQSYKYSKHNDLNGFYMFFMGVTSKNNKA